MTTGRPAEDHVASDRCEPPGGVRGRHAATAASWGPPPCVPPSAQGRTSVELNGRFTRKYTAPGLPGWGKSAEKVTGLNAPRPMPGGALKQCELDAPSS